MLRVRAYQPEDARLLTDIFYRSIHQSTGAFYTAAQQEAWAPSPPDYDFFSYRFSETLPRVAISGTAVAGFIELRANGYIDCLYVDPDLQRQGVASQLLADAERMASEANLTILETDASYLARPFFTRHGFELVRQNQLERRGEVLTNFRMKKALP
ncbi:GNAT family N-acetyltransferase [Marinobacterium jannaschii]|uniref:GNAT family N-acetyltransferase n=1 Tax=Marinobacterium jannaschii TaxID=64970 RepID=UPI0004883C03|nr:GNAT family N-acetyltransferase [Marinobacterium jannaschii]